MQRREPFLVFIQERHDESEVVQHAGLGTERGVARNDRMSELVLIRRMTGMHSLESGVGDEGESYGVPIVRTVSSSDVRKRMPSNFVPG